MTVSDLLLPDQMTLRGAGEALAGALPIEDGAQGERPAQLLRHVRRPAARAAGLSLVHEDGELSLVEQETGLVRVVAGDAAAADAAVRAPSSRPGPLRDALRDADRRSRAAAARPGPRARAAHVGARRRAQDRGAPRARGDSARRGGRSCLAAAPAAADHRRPRLRRGAPQRPGDARSKTSGSSPQTSRWSTRR